MGGWFTVVNVLTCGLGVKGLTPTSLPAFEVCRSINTLNPLVTVTKVLIVVAHTSQ